MKIKMKISTTHTLTALALSAVLSLTSAHAADVTKPQSSDSGKAASADALQKLREAQASDPYRPLYHYSASVGVLHDPTGLCEWKGKYHLFYLAKNQRGHAVSDDLVHWQELPMIDALDGGTTGQTLATDDRMLMSITRKGGINIATASDPMLLNWECSLVLPSTFLKGFQGPVDSCIWKEDDQWCLLVRKHRWDLMCLTGTRPALERFDSTNLKDWTAKGLFCEKETAIEPGDDMACPNFMSIGGGRHLLINYCHPRGPMYSLGTYDREKGRFFPEYHGRFSFGPPLRGSLHAPSAFVDSRGRCMAIFNITDNRKESVHPKRKGVMSMPRQLSLRENFPSSLLPQKSKGGDNVRDYFNPFRIEPVVGFESLRFNPVERGTLRIPANGEQVLSGVQGKAMELEVVIDPKQAREVGLHVLRSPDGKERTTIRLYMKGTARAECVRELSIDVSDASLDPAVEARSPELGPLWLEPGELLRLRVFVDRSIIEVFANDRQCLTVRAYPTCEESNGVAAYAKGSDAELVSLKAWQMHSIWPELKGKEGK